MPCKYPQPAPAVPAGIAEELGDVSSARGGHNSLTGSAAVVSPGFSLSAADSPAPRSAEAFGVQDLPVPDLPVPGAAANTGFGMHDLVLLHHWTLFTSRDIPQSPSADYCWHTVFPRIAFRHPFVMHGILSLAALHLAHGDPSSREQHTLNASRHHSISLQGLHRAIDHIGDDNADALFAASVLNVIYIFAMMKPFNHGARGISDSSRSRIICALGTEWIPMIRGVRVVLQPVYERVRLGPLSPLINLGSWDDLDVDLNPSPDDDVFRSIRECWSQSPELDKQYYDETLQILRKCRLYITQSTTMDARSLPIWGHNRGWAGPLVFLHLAPEEYFTRLHQRQPPALILYAYFGALLHNMDGFWFMEGWGRDVVQVVDELLGDYWISLMKWPKGVVGIT